MGVFLELLCTSESHRFLDEKQGKQCLKYDNGISVSKETYKMIEHEIESLNSKYTILKCKPECEIK